MALESYALITLAQLKVEIGTIDDASVNTYLESVINRVSRRFETVTKRKLKARTYKASGATGSEEDLVLNGNDRLSSRRFMFPHPPLNSIASIVIWNRVLDDSTTLTIATDVVFEPETGFVDMIGGDAWTLGLQNIKAEWNSGYATIEEDLRDACVIQCVHEFNKKDRSRHGIQSASFEGESVSYVDTANTGFSLLPEVFQVVSGYRLPLVA